MNPIAMAVILVGLFGLFAWSAHRRWLLLQVGSPTLESRTSHAGSRLRLLWTYAFYQKKLRNYLAAGLAHNLIFAGFLVLLARSIILWGRGFVPEFNLFVLGPDPVAGLPLGQVYAFLKDLFAGLVLVGVGVFIYYRVIVPQRRMTLGWEGLVILVIIAVMMLSDLLYDGAGNALNVIQATDCSAPGASSPEWCGSAARIVAPLGPAPAAVGWSASEPGGSAFAVLLAGVSPGILVVLAHVGFWLHAALVPVFLNVLPYTKHFHILTALPNVYFGDLGPAGRLPPVAEGTEQLMGMVDQAMQKDDMLAAPIGAARIEHFTWKDILDFYTCTECGRCTDHCPANITGKQLSPKQFTLDLRNHLYERQTEFSRPEAIPRVTLAELKQVDSGQPTEGDDPGAETEGADSSGTGRDRIEYQPVDLVSGVIHEDVLWACLTCRACEEQCPVNISYVDKIVQMRRNLVMIRGEAFPSELAKPFEGMETNGNPWNLSQMDRAAWAEGLDVPRLADRPDAPVLFWVGCAPSFDDRAKKVARAMVELMRAAGVDFAILGDEESCTGDAARRAGNEFLFAMLAEQNVATINQYVEQGGAKQIVTTCPHCYNTLAHEYPDFGGRYDVIHHTDYLLRLVVEGKLKPKHELNASVAYHDSCYLARYNGIIEAPRELLSRIPGCELREVDRYTRSQAFCCGAGGAQMWMEEQNKDRVNEKRTAQLLATGAQTLATACPFCLTMVTDGLKAADEDEQVRNLDVAELLARACGVSQLKSQSGVEKPESPSA
jgi:Fe-S oxidoreductase